MAAYEEEAHMAIVMLDAVEGKTDDALLAFEAIKNVVAYCHCKFINGIASECFSFSCVPTDSY